MKSPYAIVPICFIIACFVGIKCKDKEPNRCGVKVPCDDSQCIDKEGWCDGTVDCNDGSDEEYCKDKKWYQVSNPNTCTDKHFECSGGMCVPLAVVCDEYENCKDGSDENDCEESTERETFKEEDISIEYGLSNYSVSQEDDSIQSSSESSRTTTENIDETTLSYSATYPVNSPWNSWPTSPIIEHYDTRWAESMAKNKDIGNLHYGRTKQPSGYTNNQYDNQQQPYSDRSHSHRSRGSDIAPDEFEPFQTPGQQQQHSYTTSLPPASRRRVGNTEPRMDSPRPSSTVAITLPESRKARNSISGQQPRTTRRPSFIRFEKKHIFSQVFYPEPARDINGRYYPNSPTSLTTLQPLLPFHFQTNYTAQFGFKYTDAVQIAENWIISKKGSHFGWGDDTPRALVALSLITNSFHHFNNSENDSTRKSLAIHLGIKLLKIRKTPSRISDSRLALYINSLLATCQDPRQFLGYDLMGILNGRRFRLTQHQTNPLLYLTLCLTDIPVQTDELRGLENLLANNSYDERSKDRKILAMTALACFQKKNVLDDRLKRKLQHAVQELLRSRYNDGSFGSVYSTALAAQALISNDVSNSWNPEPTMDYLIQHQQDDGSFGDMLATYYVLPVLCGRSLLHLRNTQCDNPPPIPPNPDAWIEELLNKPEPKYTMYYTLKIGYPENSSLSVLLRLPLQTNFFDAMRVAQFLNPRFRFLYKEINGEIDVYSILGVPNDPERDYRWNLYVMNAQDNILNFDRPYNGSITELIPENNQEMIFWYLLS